MLGDNGWKLEEICEQVVRSWEGHRCLARRNIADRISPSFFGDECDRLIISHFGIYEFGIVKRWRKRRLLQIPNYERAYKAFRKRLREAREQAGLTQTEAALALKTHQSFLSKCESGERRVDYVELKEFARLYKVPVSFFD